MRVIYITLQRLRFKNVLLITGREPHGKEQNIYLAQRSLLSIG